MYQSFRLISTSHPRTLIKPSFGKDSWSPSALWALPAQVPHAVQSSSLVLSQDFGQLPAHMFCSLWDQVYAGSSATCHQACLVLLVPLNSPESSCAQTENKRRHHWLLSALCSTGSSHYLDPTRTLPGPTVQMSKLCLHMQADLPKDTWLDRPEPLTPSSSPPPPNTHSENQVHIRAVVGAMALPETPLPSSTVLTSSY